MKRLFLIAMTVPVIAFAGPERTPIQWVHVPDLDVKPNVETYVDVNSRGLVDTAIGPLQGGSILFSKKEKGKVNSMVRYYLIDCKTAVYVKIADFFFDIEKPEATSKPTSAKKYKDDEPNVLNKDQPLYKTLCPVYI
jgi:hypothetical protein